MNKDQKVYFLIRIYKTIPLFIILAIIFGSVMLILAMRHVETSYQMKLLIFGISVCFYLPSIVFYLIRMFYLKKKIESIKNQ